MLIDIAYAAEATENAVEKATDGGALASLGINGTLFIFQLINFAIVAVILWFLILKPLTKKMSERQKMIEQSIDNAKKIETNLGMSERKYQEKIDQAKIDANKIMEKAQQEALLVAGNLKEKAKQEIELLVEQARKNIKIEKADMMSEVKKEAASLVVAAVEKIISEKIDSIKDNKMIAEAIKDFKSYG